MCPLCAQYAPTMFRNYCGMKSMVPHGAPYAPTMCSLGAHCMSTVNCFRTKPVCGPLCAPRCACFCSLCARVVKSMGPQCAPYVPRLYTNYGWCCRMKRWRGHALRSRDPDATCGMRHAICHAHYVSKPGWEESDEPIMCCLCAHYAPSVPNTFRNRFW